MNKKLLTLTIASLFALIAFASFGSAYHYGNNNNYFDSYSYTSSRSNGYYGGPIYTNTRSLSRINTQGYLRDGTFQRTTAYIRTSTESPRYHGYNSGYYNYPRNYYSYSYRPQNYGYFNNYYPSYSYRPYY